MSVTHAEHGKVFDLNTIPRDKTSTVVKHEHFEAIRLVVEPDNPIPDHKVKGPITVQCLEGTCEFVVEGDVRPMVPGSWLYLDGETMHAVNALETTKLLVTILFVKE